MARPYAGLNHDANLYALQVLNRVHDGAFGNDLFLRYGSQDQYSLFSPVVTPFAAVLGLEWSFLGIYLVSNTLLILALTRLVLAIIDDRRLSAISLAFMAAAPLTYGAFHTFHVHENFLTPRLGAEALVAFGLERLLRRRFLASLALLGLAMLVHPIMAVGGLMVWAASFVLTSDTLEDRPGARKLVAAGLGMAVLAVASIGYTAFERMDPEWAAVVRAASPHTFPSEWRAQDWTEVAALFLIVLSTAWLWREESPARSQFLALVSVAAAGGLLGTAVSAELGYALPFQAQLYRVLWIPKAIQVPLGFWLIRHCILSGRPLARLAATLLIAYFGATQLTLDELLLPGLLFVPVALLVRGAARRPARPAWLAVSIAVSFVLGFAAWSAMAVVFVVSLGQVLLREMGGATYVRLLVATIGPAIWFLLIAGTLILVSRVGRLRWLPAAAVVTAITVPLASGTVRIFGTLTPDALPSSVVAHTRELELVRRHLAGRTADGRDGARPLASVYGYWGRIDFLWFKLGVTSFFDTYQLAGALFHRETAIEGRRRALLARPFEIERIRTALLPPTQLTNHWVARLYLSEMTAPRPTESDILRLCDDEAADVAILRQGFQGLYVATTGQSFIYDCRQLRSNRSVGRGGVSR